MISCSSSLSEKKFLYSDSSDSLLVNFYMPYTSLVATISERYILANNDSASSSLSSASVSHPTNSEHQLAHRPITMLNVLGALGNTIFRSFRFPILLVLLALSILTANISFVIFLMGGFMFATYAWALHASLVSHPLSLDALLSNGWRIYWASTVVILSWTIPIAALLFASIPLLRWAFGQEMFDIHFNIPLPFSGIVWLFLLFIVAAEVTSQNRGLRAHLTAPFRWFWKYWQCALLFLLLTNVVPIVVAYPSLVQFLDSAPTINDWLQGVPEVHWLLSRHTLDSISGQKQFAEWLWIFALFTTLGALIQLSVRGVQNGTDERPSPNLSRVNAHPWPLAALFLVAGLIVGVAAFSLADSQENLMPTQRLVEYGNRQAQSLHYESEETLLLANMDTVCRLNTTGWFNKCQWLWHIAEEDSYIIAAEFIPSSQRFMTVTVPKDSAETGENILRVHSMVDGHTLNEVSIPWLKQHGPGLQDRSLASDETGEHAAAVTTGFGKSLVVGKLKDWENARAFNFETRIDDVAISPDGQHLITLTDSDALLTEWRKNTDGDHISLSEILVTNMIDSERMIHDETDAREPQKIRKAIFAADGSSIIVMTKTAIEMLDATTHKLLYTISFDDQHEDVSLTYIRLASDPNYAIVVGGGKPVNLSQAPGIQISVAGVNQSFAYIIDLTDGQLIDSISASFSDVDFLPSQNYLAIAGRKARVTQSIWGTSFTGDSTVALYRVNREVQ